MKKSLIILVSLLSTLTLGCLKANAQSQDFFVRVGGGVGVYWGEDDLLPGIGNRLAPQANITVGKWFNPYWGVQLSGTYGKIKGGGIGETPYSTGEVITDPHFAPGNGTPYFEKFNFLTIQPEIVYNVSNGMCGYNEKRVWNVLAHIGPSYGHSSANGQSANAICATAGLTSTWRICRNVQAWATGRLTVFNKGFDKVTYRDDMDIMANISAGVSVNF